MRLLQILNPFNWFSSSGQTYEIGTEWRASTASIRRQLTKHPGKTRRSGHAESSSNTIPKNPISYTKSDIQVSANALIFSKSFRTKVVKNILESKEQWAQINIRNDDRDILRIIKENGLVLSQTELAAISEEVGFEVEVTSGKSPVLIIEKKTPKDND